MSNTEYDLLDIDVRSDLTYSYAGDTFPRFPIDHEQHHMEHLVNSQIDLSHSIEHACAYCGVFNPQCVIKCNLCNKWFCNDGDSSGGSHIITHLVLSKHNAVQTHPSSVVGDSVLECYLCGNHNIFVLGFVSAKEANTVVILCRLPCAQKKDPKWDTENWQALIEDRKILNWLVQEPRDEDKIHASASKITTDQMRKLESKWRIDKDATLDDLVDETEIEVAPILMRYGNGYEYQRSFAPLVKLEADYDKALKESRGLEYLTVDWSIALNNKHLASFTFSAIDSATMKVAIGDEMILRYSGPELNQPWEGKGYIIRIPDARQELYTLELTFSDPPTHITNRFTGEFIWKGITYERMQNALMKFAIDENCVSQYLYEKLLGNSVEDIIIESDIPNKLQIPGMPRLNESQANAVRQALSTPLTLIQGPPGTGKTNTSATIVYHLNKMFKKEKILVCAPSNVAVDHLAKKLDEMGLNVVRLMAKSREDVDNGIEHLRVSRLVEENSKGQLKKLIGLKKEVGELSHSDEKSYLDLYRKKEKNVLQNADIICCTCAGSGDWRLDNLNFCAVLIDESTQASEPETLIPITRGTKRVVLVGDHQQLGPVILNQQAANAGLKQSLFERLIFLNHKPIRLEVQYRMHPCLSEFPSNMFYDGSLQNGITEEDRIIYDSSFPWPIYHMPMMFWAVYGREEISMSGTSFLNRVEAMNVEKIVTKLFRDGVTSDQIGIITPYEGQRTYIHQYMSMNHTLADKQQYLNIEILSIDAFQGREKDYIILSCVRANASQLIGFLRDPRRLNVALTRAKYGLIILGNPKSLNKNRLWNKLLIYYRERGCLVEGQLDNLQISTVQLSRVQQRYDNIRSSKVSSSQQSFDTASLVSYNGNYFDTKYPSLNQSYGYEDEDDRETIMSYSDIDSGFATDSGVNDSVVDNINIPENINDPLVADIEKLAQSFGSFTF